MSCKKILFATLNWGLGHATRGIPIIHHLLSQGHLVFLASDGASGVLLKQEFPGLPYLPLPSYAIRYPEENFYGFWVSEAVRLKGVIAEERKMVRKWVLDYHFDVIISDNRYGVLHPQTQNIIITHQLSFTLPVAAATVVNQMIRYFVNRFDHCWIPDFHGHDNLSGKLSQGSLNIEKHFIGPLSRFQKQECVKSYDLGIIISGPEPHRSTFQRHLERHFKYNALKIFWVLGLPGKINEASKNVNTYNHLSSQKMNEMLNQTQVVLSRSGYSSIMDYYQLSKKAILIPTPNQPEQKYLADRHQNGSSIFVPSQDLGDLLTGLEKMIHCRHEPVNIQRMQIPKL
ncbi:MAG: glycosyltransferase [Saprospiraceae bacterium]|nr:glycosyltransferase [Saprospiraceae bacterium]